MHKSLLGLVFNNSEIKNVKSLTLSESEVKDALQETSMAQHLEPRLKTAKVRYHIYFILEMTSSLWMNEQ